MVQTSHWKHASELLPEQWRERLEDYIRAGDRDIEPVFVGREALFERADASLQNALRGRHGSLTIAIGGAPGAGKSAFVAECVRRHRIASDAVPVELHYDKLRPGNLVLTLAAALGEATAERTSHTHGARGRVSLGMASADASAADVTERPGLVERAEREGIVPWRTIRDAFGNRLAGRPILLFLDEAQNFTKAGNGNCNMPGELHQGPPKGEGCIPIIPVYTGLADTGSILRHEAGVTRSVETSMIPLGGLTPAESTEYVRKVAGEYLGATGRKGQVSALYRWLVSEGDRWPQHMRSANAALAECMLEADSHDLADIDPERLLVTAERRRNAFYQDRADGVMEDRFRDVADAVVRRAAAAEGSMLYPLEELASDLLQAKLDPPTGRDFLTAMIHAGMLQKGAGRLLVCPIPSMGRWLETGQHHMSPLDLAEIPWTARGQPLNPTTPWAAGQWHTRAGQRPIRFGKRGVPRMEQIAQCVDGPWKWSSSGGKAFYLPWRRKAPFLRKRSQRA